MNRQIILLIIVALLIRVLISFLPAHSFDQYLFLLWSDRLAEGGSLSFYSSDIPTNNPVGFLYVLWFIGLLINFLSNLWQLDPHIINVLHKLPTNLADITTGIIIYFLLKKSLSIRWANIGFLAYTLNPALIFDSAVWGQYDGLATLFLVLATYLIVTSKAIEISALAISVALSLKPQAIAFAPFLGLLILISSNPLKWVTSAATFIFTTFLIYLPFFPTNPLKGIISLNNQSLDSYNCTTCFAFNFWGLFGNGFGVSNDLNKFLGLNLLSWGVIVLGVSLVIIFFYSSFRSKFKPPLLYLTATLSLMAFYILLTRIHERYIYPVFPFLLLSALLLRSRFLMFIYGALSFLYLLNLYVTYVSANSNLALTPKLVNIVFNYFNFFSLLVVICFILSFIYFIKIMRVNK